LVRAITEPSGHRSDFSSFIFATMRSPLAVEEKVVPAAHPNNEA
jgi:hypothetical protein